jgi:type II secretory pathway component PulL
MARTALIPSLNFLRQRRHKLAALRRKDKYLLYGSIGILSTMVLVSLVLGFYLFQQSRQYNQLLAKDEQANRTLKTLVNEEAEYLIFSARLKTLATLWPERGSQQETLKFLTAITLPNVAYQQITFSQKTHKLEFSVSAQDFFAFDDFVNRLKTPDIQAQIESFTVGSVRRNEEGKYTFLVEMVLKGQT